MNKEPDIIERIPAYSNKRMYEEMFRLDVVCNQTSKTVKVGRGKNQFTYEKDKFFTRPEYKERIKRSVKYYKALMIEENGFQLRDYQIPLVDQGVDILRGYDFLYLMMEVRTGKTLTSLAIAEEMGVTNILFLTKKKAMSSIEDDYQLMKPNFQMTCINYESVHKVPATGWDLIILDEAHSMGAFPKPAKRSKQVKNLIKMNNPLVILLSGTPTPESYSQMYHQVWGIPNNPFRAWDSFYKFAKDEERGGGGYVNVTQKKVNSFLVNDYTDGRDSIISEMDPYTISYTQKAAGFKVNTKEHIIEVEMSDMTYHLAKRLKKDRVIEGKEDVILADTPVKLMMKLHQLYSGTIKFEPKIDDEGKETQTTKIIDPTKAQFIHDNWLGHKIGIFYNFTAELKALKEVFGDDLCTELSVFKDTDKSIALQIVSGREGISLKEADCLVYYNIAFSATSYWQSRDRMTTKDRLESDIYWIFAKGGIERDIYDAVSKKKDYTLRHFRKDNQIK